MVHNQAKREGGSQTLSRGLTALSLIANEPNPMSVSTLAGRLGIHRSMAYRLVATLEQHGLVSRDPVGNLELGLNLVTLARGVAKNLQSISEQELAAVADELHMTAFVSVLDGDEAVTLNSVVPRAADITVAHRPGSRHSIHAGAPGRVIRSQRDAVAFPPLAYESSHDEVLPGLASIAVPLRLNGHGPAAVAVVFPPQSIDEPRIVEALSAAARRIEARLS